jgi:hypothetical protein
MQVKEITYSTTINLGNFENERIEFTADLNEGEEPSEALRNLKEMVLQNTGSDQTQPEAASSLDGLFLRDAKGVIRAKHQTSSAWLRDYEDKARLTTDVLLYLTANEPVFVHIKSEAKANPNPRVIQRVLEVEQRVSELANG